MIPEDLIKGAERIHKLNEILKELTLTELEFLYDTLPAIIKFKKNER